MQLAIRGAAFCPTHLKAGVNRRPRGTKTNGVELLWHNPRHLAAAAPRTWLLGGTMGTSMHFETSAGQHFANPSASQIAEHLAMLPAGADSFAILSRDELTYIQTGGAPSEGFTLEYQEGSTKHHYRSTQSNLPLSTIINAFQLYAVGDSSWRSLATWER